jgi:uncharacterized protein (TIGR00369 family)
MSGEEHNDAPPGFVKLPLLENSGFGSSCGPFWIKAEGTKEAQRLVGGFRVEARHCNPARICHGGMLATFCDLHLGVAAEFQYPLGTFILPTISLSLDYLAPTPKGAWVEARAEISKVTRSMVFASETVTADGEPVVRAHGIFKIPSQSNGAPTIDTGARLRAFLAR